MCFNQTGDISTLNGSSLKLVDKFTYLGSSVSSTEKDIDTRLTKAWTAIDRLSVIWKSDLTDKMKRSFFQVANITGTSPSDCLVTYPGYSLGESYPSAEMQSCRCCYMDALHGQPLRVKVNLRVMAKKFLTALGLEPLNQMQFRHISSILVG